MHNQQNVVVPRPNRHSEWYFAQSENPGRFGERSSRWSNKSFDSLTKTLLIQQIKVFSVFVRSIMVKHFGHYYFELKGHKIECFLNCSACFVPVEQPRTKWSWVKKGVTSGMRKHRGLLRDWSEIPLGRFEKPLVLAFQPWAIRHTDPMRTITWRTDEIARVLEFPESSLFASNLVCLSLSLSARVKGNRSTMTWKKWDSERANPQKSSRIRSIISIHFVHFGFFKFFSSQGASPRNFKSSWFFHPSFSTSHELFLHCPLILSPYTWHCLSLDVPPIVWTLRVFDPWLTTVRSFFVAFSLIPHNF